MRYCTKCKKHKYDELINEDQLCTKCVALIHKKEVLGRAAVRQEELIKDESLNKKEIKQVVKESKKLKQNDRKKQEEIKRLKQQLEQLKQSDK